MDKSLKRILKVCGKKRKSKRQDAKCTAAWKRAIAKKK